MAIKSITVEEKGKRRWLKMKPLLALKLKKIARLILEPLSEYEEAKNQLIEQIGVPATTQLTPSQVTQLSKENLKRLDKLKVILESDKHYLKSLTDVEYALDLPTISEWELDGIFEPIAPELIDYLKPILLEI